VSAAHGTLGQAGGEGAVGGLEFGSAAGKQGLKIGGRDRAQAVNDGAGAHGGKHLLRVLGEQDQRSMLGRLFQNLEKAVGRLPHKRGRRKDGEGTKCLDRRAVVGGVNRLADLAQLDEQLRRVGRDNEHVGMGLDEDSGLALVSLAEGVAGFDGLVHQGLEAGREADARAVAAHAAEVGQAVRFVGLQTVDGFGQHQGQGVLACPARPGQDERVGKTPGADALAEMGDGWRVAEELLEAHGLSLEHRA